MSRTFACTLRCLTFSPTTGSCLTRGRTSTSPSTMRGAAALFAFAAAFAAAAAAVAGAHVRGARRYYIEDLFPGVDRMVYLDYDTVVQADISELYHTDMKGLGLGAVENCEFELRAYVDLNLEHPFILKCGAAGCIVGRAAVG